MDSLRDQAAIVGIGETVYNRDSGRTELSMAVEAAKKAIADAGLETRDIDGIVKFTADSTSQGDLASTFSPKLCGGDIIMYPNLVVHRLVIQGNQI